MLDYVIVRINEKLIPELQINYNVNNSSAQSIAISSWSQIKLESHQELILILPAILVFSKEVKIPSKNEEVINQSLPFTLEENLSTEISDNHFAYEQSGENLFNVCVVAKEVMKEINLQLENNLLNCKKLYSEIFSLPASSEILSILNVNDYFIVNNNNTGTRLSAGLINQYIELSEATKIHVYTDKPLSLTSGIIEYKKVDTKLFQVKLLLNNRVVNLFQGIYNNKIDKKNKIKSWKKSLAIVVFLLVSWMVINVFQLWDFNQKINEIKNKQHDLLVKLIPNASKSEINDPYSAFQSRMKYVETRKTNNSNGFIESLLFIGQTLIKHSTIQVVSIRQRDNKIEIKIHAPNVNKLNEFQASLETIALARHVKTGTRESTKDGIISVVTMEKL